MHRSSPPSSARCGGTRSSSAASPPSARWDFSDWSSERAGAGMRSARCGSHSPPSCTPSGRLSSRPSRETRRARSQSGVRESRATLRARFDVECDSPAEHMDKPQSTFGRIYEDVRRRKVFRATALYGVIAWFVIQAAEATFEPLNLPQYTHRLVVIAALAGFPIVVILAWLYDITSGGFVRTPATVAAVP